MFRRKQSGKEARLPEPPPLRTARACSHACSSSIGQRTANSTRLPALALGTTCTLLSESRPTEPLEAAPARALRSADISALLPQTGWPTIHVRQHQREVCRLSPWGDLAARRNPYPAHYRPAFACSLLLYPPPFRRALRRAFPAGRPARKTTGLPRSAVVAVWGRSRLFAGGPAPAPADRITAGLDHMPFGPSVTASFACWS